MAASQSTSLSAVMARVFWILVGPAALSILAIRIADNHQGWLSTLNIAFVVVLALVATARWLDPLDTDGHPVDAGQLRKSLAILVGLGLVGGAAANLLGIYWLDAAS